MDNLTWGEFKRIEKINRWFRPTWENREEALLGESSGAIKSHEMVIMGNHSHLHLRNGNKYMFSSNLP